MKLLQYCYFSVLWINGLRADLLIQARGEMDGLPEVTAVLLYNSARDIWSDCSIVCTMYREISFLATVKAVQLRQSGKDKWIECSILLEVRGEMEGLPAVTAVQLHQSPMVTWTKCGIVSKG